MPHTAQNKNGAWKLIQYLCSKPVMTQLEEGRRELKLSAGQLYLPKSVANRTVFESLVQKYIDGNPDIPPCFQQRLRSREGDDARDDLSTGDAGRSVALEPASSPRTTPAFSHVPQAGTG